MSDPVLNQGVSDEKVETKTQAVFTLIGLALKIDRLSTEEKTRLEFLKAILYCEEVRKSLRSE